MIEDLPNDLQSKIRSVLASGDFLKAKKLHDAWLSDTECAEAV